MNPWLAVLLLLLGAATACAALLGLWWWAAQIGFQRDDEAPAMPDIVMPSPGAPGGDMIQQELARRRRAERNGGV